MLQNHQLSYSLDIQHRNTDQCLKVGNQLLSAGMLPAGCLGIRDCLVSISSLTSSPVIMGYWSEFPPLVSPRGVVIIKAIMFFKDRDVPD